MKQMRLFFYSLLAATILFACQGEDGVDGTNGLDGSGVTKRGYFEGTVSGKRADGTSFSETFKYEYGNSSNEAFGIDEYDSENPVIKLFRGLTPSDESANLLLHLELLNEGESNETLAPFITSYENRFNFFKELSSTSVFMIEATPRFQDFNFQHFVNPTLNATYKFAFDHTGNFDYVENGDEAIFKTTDGKQVFYEPGMMNFDPETGYGYGDLIKVLDSDGNIMANSPYDQLRWATDGGSYQFFSNVDNVDQSSTELVPGDDLTITNYEHDPVTGIISFDFTLVVGATGRYNTTRHPLTITGKFNSGETIYTDATYRKSK